MQIIIKRRADGPSVPELGTPTSVTFDSVTVPLNRPSTGPAAISAYQIERATSSSGPWTVAATGALIFGNPATQYVDGGRLALTTYFYRAKATDTSGRESAYSATVSVTTPEVAGNSEVPAINTQTPTKYVSASGSYLGNSAYTTLQAAFDAAVPGDVIAIAPGTYAQRAIITRSGTASQPIYVRPADYGARPTFDGQYSTSVVPGWASPFNAGRTQLLSVMANYVTIDGLNFIRSREGGILVGDAANNGNFTFAISTFYTGNKILRCSVIGSETAFRTINVDGLDVMGCTFVDCQRNFYRADGFPEDNPTWGSAVSLMGKRINFIENTVGQSSGEGIHLGIHIRFGDENTFIQCENVVLRNNRIFDCWSAPLYVSNVDGGVIERNVVYQSGDVRYWQYGGSGYPKYCIDIASESGDSGVGGWPPPNGFIGARDLIIRNNIITGALYCFRFSDWPSQATTRVKILNNTFYRSVGGTASSIASLIANEESSLSDITFQNNLVYDAVPAQMCRQWLTPSGTWTRSNNLFSTTPPLSLSGQDDVITASPRMNNVSYTPANSYPAYVAFDTNAIRLQSGSPAIGAGAVLADVTNDFFGNPRSSTSNDIGAHQAGSIVSQPIAAILSSRFTGLGSIVLAQSYSNGREYRLEGTDSTTGQVFSTTSPQLWGAQSGAPQIQCLTDTSHVEPGINPDTNWALSFVTGSGLRIVRGSPYIQADQAAYRIKPSSTWQAQGMTYIRGKIRLDASWPTGDQFLALAEVKIAGTNQKVEAQLARESGVWWLKLSATRADGGGEDSIWGTGSTASATCTPTQDAFFQSAGQDIFFRSFTPTFGSWMTYEFAFRLQDGLGQVQGSASTGWCYAAITTGDSTNFPVNGSATARLYVEGRNMHGDFSGSAPDGATIVFPFNCYTDADITGLSFDVGSIEVYNYWRADASEHPAGAV